MLAILSRQEFNDEIPAGLPPGTRVAHKTGSITAVLHDAAIVYPQGEGPYVLVVLTRNIPDERVARTLIADLSRLVYSTSRTDGTDELGAGRRIGRGERQVHREHAALPDRAADADIAAEEARRAAARR